MTYSSEVLADSPAVYWRLGETSGATAADASGNSRPGTYGGTPGYGATGLLTGDSDTAVTFSGDDYVSRPWASWQNTAALTVEAIVKTSAVGAFRSIWDRDSSTISSRVFQFRLSSGGKLEFILIGSSVVTVTSVTSINDNVPHHVAATYNGTHIRLYIDGVQDQVVATTVPLPQPAGSVDLSLGVNRSVSSGAQFFVGVIDEAAYYTVALDAGRIAAHAAAMDGQATLSGGTATADLTLAAALTHSASLDGTLSVDVGLTSGALAFNPEPLVGWNLDTSQRFAAPVALHAVLEHYPAPVPPPDSSYQLTRRVSPTMPTPTLDANGVPQDWQPSSVLEEPWARLQLLVDGQDVTFLRGVPVLVQQWTAQTPFQDATLSFLLPQVTEFEPLGEGDLAWLRKGAKVDLRGLDADGNLAVVQAARGWMANLWSGQIDSQEGSISASSAGVQVQCTGAILQAGWSVLPPAFSTDARDLGEALAAILNDNPGRTYGFCQPVPTGIQTRTRGSFTTRTAAIQDLLATATTDDGQDQWTIAQKTNRVPEVRIKDRTTVHHTVTIGTPGITHRLVQDLNDSVNVIYGEGTDPDGCHWRNTKYPNLRADDAPIYPHAPTTLFNPGDGLPGFAPFADELRRSGYRITSTYDYAASDERAVRDAQKRAGVQVDGIVGPQTWAAVFQTGSNGGDLTGVYFAPLAFDSRVMPRLYNAGGEDIGPNPDYDPSLPRIERFINYGESISKDQAIRSAEAEIQRDADPGWYGTVTLTVDPEEQSRFGLRPRTNMLLKAFRGSDLLVQIAQVRVDWQNGTVTLTVDSKARDLVTLAGILSRNKEAATDPARRPSPLRRASRLTQDIRSVFDCESGAGIIPRHAQAAGLWTVLRIPAGQAGTIARTDFQTDGPIGAFAVAVFGRPITANGLKSLVSNPLAAERPWSENADALLAAGLIEAWGTEDEPAGYSPGALTETDPLTGRLLDNASWQYETEHPPWLWVAMYTAASCFLTGRLYPGVD